MFIKVNKNARYFPQTLRKNLENFGDFHVQILEVKSLSVSTAREYLHLKKLSSSSLGKRTQNSRQHWIWVKYAGKEFMNLSTELLKENSWFSKTKEERQTPRLKSKGHFTYCEIVRRMIPPVFQVSEFVFSYVPMCWINRREG